MGAVFLSVQHVQDCTSDGPPVQSLLEVKRGRELCPRVPFCVKLLVEVMGT